MVIHKNLPHRFFFHREIHGLVHLGKENIWEREFHKILGFFQFKEPTLVGVDERKSFLLSDDKKMICGPSIGYQDNTAAISLSKGGPRHKRSKHFGLEFDLFREYISLGELVLNYIPSEELVADLLTKPLPSKIFCRLRDRLIGGEELQSFFEKLER